MNFFESTPGGSLVKALNTAAESDQRARSQQTPIASESVSRNISLVGMLNQFRKLLMHIEIKETRTS
jgi:hypothetical protein